MEIVFTPFRKRDSHVPMNTNERTSKTKLFAAVAVLAMVVCVFAIAVPAWESDADDAYFGNTINAGNVELKLPAGMTASGSGNDVAISGVAQMAPLNQTVYGEITFTDIYGATANGFAVGVITNLDKMMTGVDDDTSFQIKSTISGYELWEDVWPANQGNTQFAQNADGSWTLTKTWSWSNSDKTAAFLIPKDGSTVKLEILVDKGAGNYQTQGTYTIDCSDVTTKVVLTDGVNGIGWTYTSESATLAFNNYTGQEQFVKETGDLNVTLTGDNTITANTPGTSGTILGSAILAEGKNRTAATITVTGTEANASLTINQKNAMGMGIGAANVEIGNTTYAIDIDLNGGNRGINAQGTTGLKVTNATLDISASEKGIRGGAVDIDDSDITIELEALTPVNNSAGVDDRYGIKAATINVDDKSTVTTMGLDIFGTGESTIAKAGIIVVNGGYEQNLENDTTAVAGLHYAGSSEINVIRGVPSAPAAGNIYIAEDAGVYGTKVTVTGSSAGQNEVSVDNKTNVQTSLNNASNSKVTFNVTTEVTLEGQINVPSGKEFVIVVSGSGSISGTVTTANGGSVTLSGVKGVVSITNGSVRIDGAEVSGTFTAALGSTVYMSGYTSSGETLTVQAANTGTGATPRIIVDTDLKITASSTINFNNVELIVSDNGTINVEAGSEINLVGTEMSISGKVLGTTGTIDADEDSSVYVTSGGIIAPVLTGEGAYYIDDAMQEYRISKDVVSDINTTSQQKVYIDNSITIYSGFTVYIAGTLEVADGMRVIIEDGAQLIVEGVNSTADISGNIIIKGANGFQFTGKTMTVDGSISVNSNSTTSALIIDGKTELNGTITVQKNAAASLDEISVNAGATLTVNGIASGDVTNYGSVVMNGAAAGFTVSQQEGGVVTVASVSGTMSVTDNGMVLRKGIVAGTSAGIGYNTISFNNVTGMTVTSSVGSQTGNNGQKVYFPVMTLTGTAGAVKDASSPTVGIIAGTVTVSDLLTIGKIGVNIGSGAELDVTGTVNALSEAGTWSITGAGTLDVTGLVKTNEPIHGTGGVANINAVHYELIENSVPYYYYTNLTDALAVDVDDLEVLGNITILENTVIPDGKTVTANDIQIGDADHTDVTLTIENGALLDAGVITVIGTMEVQNDDDLDATRVVSDVSSKVEVDYITSVTYTNIYTALAQAQSGETVKITSVSGTVYLTQDVTIPAGVTLEVPTQKTLSVMEGVTLAVDGTLYLNNGDLTAFKYDNDAPATGVFGTVASETDGNTTTNRAVVTVTGMIQTNTDFDYGTYFVSGAYYDIKNYSYVTTVEKAVAVIADVDAMTIDVWGTNTIGDISVAGSADEDAILNIMYYYDAEDGIKTGGFTAGKVTLSNATVNVDGGVVLNATFSNAVGSVELVNMVAGTAPTTDNVVMDVTVTVSDTYVTVNGEETQTFTVSGTVNGVTAEKVNSASVTFDGAVTVMDNLTIDPKYQYTTGTSKVGSVTVVGDVTVTGNGVEFKVDSSIQNDDSNVIIDGTLTAINAGKITLENATVNGTLTEAVKTETNTVGDISVGTLYVGLTSKDLGAAGAVVNGGVSVTSAMYVLNGCTVDSLITDNQKYTEFYVEGALWMTAYVFSETATVTVSDCPAENATLMGWNDEDGNGVDAEFVVTVNNNKVYADLEYEIYTITVFADPGIDAVYIDGKLMTSGFFMGGSQNEGMLYEGFQLKVAAGTHEITYKLGNYYSGEANLIVNGEAVTGNSFSCSGTEPADKIVTIYLQGIEASAPGTPETSSDSGMGLTDYLLIILVVLIVIMAIMVAMRLMRSYEREHLLAREGT